MSRTRRPGRRADTPPPRTGNSELEVLRGFLGYLRDSVVRKVEGAAEPAVRTAGVPSGTNLLGLVNHLAHVERSTFLGERVADWQATFHAAPEDGVADVVGRYRAAVARADDVLDGCLDPGAPLPGSHRPGPSVRWALTHLIEETARHAGHADILRELVDGATGR
ncbi:DinB family protein [Streptomyces sp. B93]|uniref:DinB family protein n=1 Tax=Streptomyces sp. B93 TaxID=2824875 RepID=UPI001B368834|nr:DinB family protein [Streptomyces sp. B93]MBQ1087933.1 DinB family protein [Streptomyces sp. B93]